MPLAAGANAASWLSLLPVEACNQNKKTLELEQTFFCDLSLSKRETQVHCHNHMSMAAAAARCACPQMPMQLLGSAALPVDACKQTKDCIVKMQPDHFITILD